MSNYSPIKNNQEMLKVICKDMKSLTNDVKCIKEMLSVITKNINDSVKVEIIEDKPNPPPPPQSQTELSVQKGWFW